jgi:hypothetical protein
VVVGPTFFLRAKQYFHIAVNMDGWKSYGVSERTKVEIRIEEGRNFLNQERNQPFV